MATVKPHILLVEDDQVLSETLVESLAIHGLPVTAVGTGLDFFKTLNLHNFAVALVDLGLPDLDGYDLVSYLRDNTDLKIIVMTARDALADRVKGYGAGADLYLIKPVDIEELVAAIFSIVNRRAAPPLPASGEFWLLKQANWQLINPEGRHFRLSQKEFRLLVKLSVSRGAPVNRDAIMTAVYEGTEEPSSRALDALISRFRAKYAAETGGTLPLQTVPSAGFVFAAPLHVN